MASAEERRDETGQCEDEESLGRRSVFRQIPSHRMNLADS